MLYGLRSPISPSYFYSPDSTSKTNICTRKLYESTAKNYSMLIQMQMSREHLKIDDFDTNGDVVDPDIPAYTRRTSMTPPIPPPPLTLLHTSTASSRRPPANKGASLKTEIAEIPDLVPQPIRIWRISGTVKRRKRATRKTKKKKERKILARRTRAIPLCYVHREKASEKSCVKLRTKRRRCSVPLSSEEATEMGDYTLVGHQQLRTFQTLLHLKSSTNSFPLDRP